MFLVRNTFEGVPLSLMVYWQNMQLEPISRKMRISSSTLQSSSVLKLARKLLCSMAFMELSSTWVTLNCSSQVLRIRPQVLLITSKQPSPDWKTSWLPMGNSQVNLLISLNSSIQDYLSICRWQFPELTLLQSSRRFFQSVCLAQCTTKPSPRQYPTKLGQTTLDISASVSQSNARNVTVSLLVTTILLRFQCGPMLSAVTSRSCLTKNWHLIQFSSTFSRQIFQSTSAKTMSPPSGSLKICLILRFTPEPHRSLKSKQRVGDRKLDKLTMQSELFAAGPYGDSQQIRNSPTPWIYTDWAGNLIGRTSLNLPRVSQNLSKYWPAVRMSSWYICWPWQVTLPEDFSDCSSAINQLLQVTSIYIVLMGQQNAQPRFAKKTHKEAFPHPAPEKPLKGTNSSNSLARRGGKLQIPR